MRAAPLVLMAAHYERALDDLTRIDGLRPASRKRVMGLAGLVEYARGLGARAKAGAPILISVGSASTGLIEVLLLCTLPTNHTTGANWRTLSLTTSAVISGVSAVFSSFVGNGRLRISGFPQRSGRQSVYLTQPATSVEPFWLEQSC
jgi:hypothetical protein